MSEINHLNTKVESSVADIMAVEGVISCAIVSTEGQIIGKSESNSASSPFLGITGATMYASAEAACSTFHVSAPDDILMETKNKDGLIIVKSINRKNLIVIIANKMESIAEIRKMINTISGNLAEDL
ncbi:putative regulator of Ras-like GTPase activity (Roadblock/LC7/MglB family) [Methanomicrobium sp. W14]|uniref:roadblock/LC7 domain-containing protein n=1 Tax=Methanomicrobium sp. W14 TaxID=2817839 RepID=UPI001AE74FB0|nr:roadblock/LC7 domain-containing protein [Methanomicrobium sp. W14]MBP2132721.1 putative regulator of Ras-like GTPase activity (Roadblock/LC7/MglB family) [Methanomicrobium sp. W14]